MNSGRPRGGRFTFNVNKTDVYCQNCRARNSLRETHCVKCGTRLLLVVFPQSLQFDTNQVPSFYEDHLLERVSLLELRLAQVSDSLRMALEIIREQGNAIKESQRAGRAGEPESAPVEAAGNSVAPAPDVLRTIVEAHEGQNSDLLQKLLAEGARLLDAGEDREGLRMIERAAMLSPRNIALQFYGARRAFHADRFAEARRLLDRCHELAPEDLDVLLLRGALFADEGDAAQARLFLSLLAENERAATVVNVVWALLAVRDDNLAEAVAALKIAGEKSAAAEISYLAGCVAYEAGDDASALRHLQKAVSLDRRYADAWFMQAAVYERLRDARAANMLANAAESADAGAQCAAFLKKKKFALETALPFAHLKREKPRLLSGGARRLAVFVKRLLEEAIGAKQTDER